MRGGMLSAPMYHLLERPARRTLFSNASKTAIGGFCLENCGVLVLSGRSRRAVSFLRLEQGRRSRERYSISILGFMGMVFSAWALVSPCVERPSVTGDSVLLRGNNEAAVKWVRRCRGGNEPRSGALMHLLGPLKLLSGWRFDAKHVRGVFNIAADGISRWDRDLDTRNLHSVRP